MQEFSFPKEQEAPGKILKESRQEKKISLEEAAAHLRIKKEYLLALENDDYNQLPSGLYGKQFLQKYCKLLKLNYNKILAQTPLKDSLFQNDPFSKKVLRSRNFLVFPKLIRNIVLLIIFLIFFFYLLFYFKRLSAPPKLIVNQPEKNLVTSAYVIDVIGISDPETEITINGSLVMSDQNGNFNQEIQLKSGLNNINIVAKKKHGRENFVQRQILVENQYEQ